MKKLTKTLLLTSTLLVSAQADFLMTMTDKNGVEENLCVKSYSFSNTLESLHKQENQTKDIYSTQETLTNKTWMGKPVYRKVIAITNQIATLNNTPSKYPLNISDLNDIVDLQFNAKREDGLIYTSSSTLRENHSFQTRTFILDNSIWMITSSPFAKVNFIVEYTKINDEIQSADSQFRTYVHYIPSNSTTNQLLSKLTNNLKIGFFENYTYDSTTDSCIAPTN